MGIRAAYNGRLKGGGLVGCAPTTSGEAVHQFCDYYHRERNDQWLENRIIEPDISFGGEGGVKCGSRLGGLLRYYYREAA